MRALAFVLLASVTATPASAVLIVGTSPARTNIALDAAPGGFLDQVVALGITASAWGAARFDPGGTVLTIPATEWIQDWGVPGSGVFGAIHDGAGFALSRTFAASDPTPFAGTTLTVYLTNFLINSTSPVSGPGNGTVFANIGVNVPVPTIDRGTLAPVYLFPLAPVTYEFGVIPAARYGDLRLTLTPPAIAGLTALLILPGESAPTPDVGVGDLAIPAPATLGLFGVGLAAALVAPRRSQR
jgi:hypothetical protein